MQKVMGIDPGLAATGIGIVTGRKMHVSHFAYGTITTPSQNTLPARLDHIDQKIRQILDAEKPDLMVVEDIFSLEKYPHSGIVLGKVTGVILLAGYQANVPVTEVSVREAKKALTGNGNASKAQLEARVRRILKLEQPIRPDHASDAVGLALIGLYRGASAKVYGK